MIESYITQLLLGILFGILGLGLLAVTFVYKGKGRIAALVCSGGGVVVCGYLCYLLVSRAITGLQS